MCISGGAWNVLRTGTTLQASQVDAPPPELEVVRTHRHQATHRVVALFNGVARRLPVVAAREADA
jgi:hypothetical protein